MKTFGVCLIVFCLLGCVFDLCVGNYPLAILMVGCAAINFITVKSMY